MTIETLPCLTDQSVAIDGWIGLTARKFEKGNKTLNMFKAPNSLGTDMLSSLASCVTRQVAYARITIQRRLFDATTIAEGNCPELSSLFDENGELSQDFADDMDPAAVIAVEDNWMNILAGLEMVSKLEAVSDDLFPEKFVEGTNVRKNRTRLRWSMFRSATGQWSNHGTFAEGMQHYYTTSRAYKEAVDEASSAPASAGNGEANAISI